MINKVQKEIFGVDGERCAQVNGVDGEMCAQVNNSAQSCTRPKV